MPGNAYLHPGMAPQISISSPEDPLHCKLGGNGGEGGNGAKSQRASKSG